MTVLQELDVLTLIIALVGGALAGSINTLAGSGSAITLGILTEVIGLPANLANGTNRVGVLAQGAASSWVFHRNRKLPWDRPSWTVILSVCAGALVGVVVAIRISNEGFRIVYQLLMVAMLAVILVKPKRWLQPEEPGEATQNPIRPTIAIPTYLAVGFYGGFIQMGVGIFLLGTLVLVSRYDLIRGNAVKTFAVFLYTIPVLAIFAWQGMVHWQSGLLLGIGQIAGGLLTAHFASRYKKADLWAYRLLVIMVVAILIRILLRASGHSPW